MNAQVIAIFNQKGGTAKTSTAVNLGAALAKSGKKVLLVDLDQQGSLSYYLAIKPLYTVVEVLTRQMPLESAIYHREGMDILAADMRLAEWELNLPASESRFRVLESVLPKTGYDFILLDCPPAISVITYNALCAARWLIAPMPLEVLSLHGLDQLIATIKKVQHKYNPALQLLGILFTIVDPSKEVTQEIYGLFRMKVNLPIFQSVINSDPAAIEAPSFGKSILSYSPSSISSVEYQFLAKEVIQATMSLKSEPLTG